jgi:hypothetical protein
MSSLEAGSEAVVAGKLRSNLWGSFSPRISASVRVNEKIELENINLSLYQFISIY